MLDGNNLNHLQREPDPGSKISTITYFLGSLRSFAATSIPLFRFIHSSPSWSRRCPQHHDLPKRPPSGRGPPVPWTISKRLKLPSIQICCLVRQHDGVRNFGLKEIVMIRTSGSGITLLTDRSVNTRQTRPVVQ
jgi:hypothetical protein